MRDVRFQIPAAAALAAILLSSCGSNERLQYGFRGRLLGTAYSATIVGNEQLDREGYRRVSQLIQTRLAEILSRTSVELPFSDISRVNQLPADVPYELSSDAFAVVRSAYEAAQQTSGAFDPTIGPLRSAWGIGGHEQQARVPGPNEIRAAARHCGWDKLELGENRRLVKRAESLTLDVVEASHGYAADEISAALRAAGWSDHTIQIGDEVIARGADRTGRPWRISLQRGETAAPGEATIRISEQAVAVSGNDRWFQGADGHIYSHQLDPRTGRPIAHNLLSASVVAESGMAARLYAQALAVLGESDGFEFARRHGIAALLLVQNESGGIGELATPEFVRLTGAPAAPSELAQDWTVQARGRR